MAQITPSITIYVRHSADCKHAANETHKTCKCRKWLRWTQDGKRQRRPAKTRSWAEAESVRRDVETELAELTQIDTNQPRTITACIEAFIAEKKVQGISAEGVRTYERELTRLRDFAAKRTVYNITSVTRELLTAWMATWDANYSSSVTKAKARERCRVFLRFCYESNFIPRIPPMTKIIVEQVPTLPLTEDEFKHLLASIEVGLPSKQSERARTRLRSLFLTMRYTGLAIRDALSLRKTDIKKTGKVYRVVTKRQKTGTDVSVPLPTHIAEEVLATPNDHPDYIFWSGNSDKGNHATKWQTRFVLPVFKAAGLRGDGTMVSHRLRDTFAVDLLQKGVPLEEVSKLLGHTSIRTTEKHYSAWVKGRQDRLDELVIATWTRAA